MNCIMLRGGSVKGWEGGIGRETELKREGTRETVQKGYKHHW